MYIKVKNFKSKPKVIKYKLSNQNFIVTVNVTQQLSELLLIDRRVLAYSTSCETRSRFINHPLRAKQ